ncbi:MAG: methyltransferase domain-containing protein [Myxococcaceae bacterium]
MILHPYQVVRALYYGQRWRLKRFLRIPDQPRNPVVDGNHEAAYERHLRICRLLNKAIQDFPSEQKGRVACEIGSGDCLSTADLLLGSGFEKVYLVEKQPIIFDCRQYELLKDLSTLSELPNSLASLSDENPPKISDHITIIPEYFENVKMPEKVDLIFSHDVIEHVEDLAGFFSGCARILKPGGVMVHKFDLSGHEFFEDPIPPLDFQTYPNWLYNLMFPKYRRSCRWFLQDILGSAKQCGFACISALILNAADREYIEKLRPLLRKTGMFLTADQLSSLDVLIIMKLEHFR